MIAAVFMLAAIACASFANNLITASGPDGRFDTGRSTCFCGKEKLSPWQLIPLLSYVLLNGKCHWCRQPIPLRYFIVELIIIGAAGLSVYGHGVTAASCISFGIIYFLIIIMSTDLLFFRIPNFSVIALVIIGAVRLYLFSEPILMPFLYGISSLSLILSVRLLALKKTGRVIIGVGDIKLIAALFFIYPFYTAPAGLWLSAFAGIAGASLIRKFMAYLHTDNRIPFGFFLALVFTVIEIGGLYPRFELFFAKYINQ